MKRFRIKSKFRFTLFARINKSLSTAKAIRRIRIRNTEFEKTTSKKIKRSQSVKGEILQ